MLEDEWMSSVNESVWLFRCYLSLSLSLLSRVFLLFRSFYVPWRWVLENFFSIEKDLLFFFFFSIEGFGGKGKGISRRVRGIVLGDEWMSSVNESVWLFRCYLSLFLSLSRVVSSFSFVLRSENFFSIEGIFSIDAEEKVREFRGGWVDCAWGWMNE